MSEVFFFTDIHGNLKLFHTIINWCLSQDPKCTIVFGGDAADRGLDGYRIIKELLNDSQIIYLYGNHEDLFIKAADAIIGAYANDDEHYEFLKNCDHNRAIFILREMSARYNEAVRLHIANGGESTLISWLEDGANEEIIDKLRTLPRTFSYENIDFCHAGGTYSIFKQAAEAEYKGEPIPYNNEQTLIWDRNMIPIGWENNRICVHGHTPTIHLPDGIYGRNKSKKDIHPCAWQDRMGSKDKRGGWKIDMDTGMIHTGRAFVLNCLTMNVTRFDAPAIRTRLDLPITIEETYNIIKED